MRSLNIRSLAIALTTGLCLQTAAYAESPDIAGIRLGMAINDALKIMNTALQNKEFVQTQKATLKLTVDGNTGTFDSYVYAGQYTTGGKIVAFSASPLTNRIWMVSKIEDAAGARPTVKALADAAGKYGKVDPKSSKPSGFKQRWMYDKAGKDVEWIDVYDKPRNGNCFERLESYQPGNFYVGLNYPIAPTAACSVIYSVGGKSHSEDGMLNQFWSSATDIAAFVDWYKVIATARAKALEAEGNRAAKPAL